MKDLSIFLLIISAIALPLYYRETAPRTNVLHEAHKLERKTREQYYEGKKLIPSIDEDIKKYGNF